MRHLRFVFFGILFGIVMVKSEAVSWFRIYEMFRFESFHMFGIIGSALIIGIIANQLIKRFKLKSTEGYPITFTPKNKSVPRYLIGGILFGLGWALAGVCPGPMYVLIGAGALPILIVLFTAILGTFVYGLVRSKLPH